MDGRLGSVWLVLAAMVWGCEEPGGDVDASTTGVAAECGDGVVQEGEACDLGFANRDGGPCRSDCTEPECGDERVDLDEGCDDGPLGSTRCTTACTERLEEVRRVVVPGVQPVSIGLGPTGRIVLGGHSSTAGATAQPAAWVRMLAASGETEWTRLVGGGTVYQVAMAGDGGAWAAGTTDAIGNGGRARVVRYDAAGEILWSWEHGPVSSANAVVPTDSGGVIVGGSFGQFTGSKRSPLAVRLDADGAQEWTWIRGDMVVGDVFDVAVTSDDAIALAGSIKRSLDPVPQGWFDLWVARLSSGGELQWEFFGDNPEGLLASSNDVVATDDGRIVVVGERVVKLLDVADPPPSDGVAWAGRIDASGTLEWEHTFDRVIDVQSDRVPAAVARSPEGWLAVGGSLPTAAAGCTWLSCQRQRWVAGLSAGGTELLSVPEPDFGSSIIPDITFTPDGTLLVLSTSVDGTDSLLRWMRVDVGP